MSLTIENQRCSGCAPYHHADLLGTGCQPQILFNSLQKSNTGKGRVPVAFEDLTFRGNFFVRSSRLSRWRVLRRDCDCNHALWLNPSRPKRPSQIFRRQSRITRATARCPASSHCGPTGRRNVWDLWVSRPLHRFSA